MGVYRYKVFAASLCQMTLIQPNVTPPFLIIKSIQITIVTRRARSEEETLITDFACVRFIGIWPCTFPQPLIFHCRTAYISSQRPVYRRQEFVAIHIVSTGLRETTANRNQFKWNKLSRIKATISNLERTYTLDYVQLSIRYCNFHISIIIVNSSLAVPFTFSAVRFYMFVQLIPQILKCRQLCTSHSSCKLNRW